jgi:hypothetical protein
MIHKITIVPIIGTNDNSDNQGDRPVRLKIRHDGTVVTVRSTTQKSTEITSNNLAPPIGVECVATDGTEVYQSAADQTAARLMRAGCHATLLAGSKQRNRKCKYPDSPGSAFPAFDFSRLGEPAISQ